MTTPKATGPYPNFVLDADEFDIVIIAGILAPGIAKVKHEKKHEWDRKKGKGATGGTATYTGSNLQEFEIIYYLWLPEHFDAWPTFAEAQAKSTPVATSAGATAAKPSIVGASGTTNASGGGVTGGTGGSSLPTGGLVGATGTSTADAAKAATTAPTTTVTQQPTALDIYCASLAEPPFKITRCIVLEAGGKEPDGKGGASYKYKYSEYNPPKPSGGTATGSKDGSNPTKPTEATAQTQGEKELADLLKKVQNP